MKLYTVKQVAKMAGVSVRALHHYDAIGLLKPASVGDNGYRYYGRAELLRLQQILFYRELEFPLEAIGPVLDRPDFDQAAALRSHRAKLAAEAGRYRRLLRTLDQTLAALEGDAEMEDNELYKGFAPEKQAEYEAWLIDKYGPSMGDQIARSWERTTAEIKTKDQAAEILAEGEAIERAIGKALTLGLPSDSAAVQDQIRKHHAWVSRFWSPNREGYIGLADLYLTHPDFVARYEAVAPGLTEYLAAGMKVFAERELSP